METILVLSKSLKMLQVKFSVISNKKKKQQRWPSHEGQELVDPSHATLAHGV